MKFKSIRMLLPAAALMTLLLCFAGTAGAQEVLLDKMEKCEDLICYPSMDDPSQYYYLPDQPALAYKNGKPQFSFLKYARTQATGEAGTGRAEGGGIVHFLVTYGASDERIRAAEKDLQTRHPDAKIAGPIVYRKGSFALITSFKEDNELTTKTVAVGKAPLMEGQKTAVSIALTREGAELLWESFKSDTPDISIVFDMEFAGIREPYEATLEADWEQVSKHDRLRAGMKYSWFGADVDMLFQELRQTGAVKITTKGESAVLDAILQSANEKLLQVMFDPAASTDLTKAASESGYESLNQAAKMLKDSSGSKSSSSVLKNSSLKKTENKYHFDPSPAERKARFFASLFNALFPESYAQAAEQKTADEYREKADSAENEQIRKASEAAFYKAQECMTNKQWEEAIRLLKESIEIYSNYTNPKEGAHANSRVNIGDCLMELKRYTEAAKWYAEAAEIAGHDTEKGKDILQRLAKAEKMAGPQLPPVPDTESKAVEEKGTDSKNNDTQATAASEAYNKARRLYEEARKADFPNDATENALLAYMEYRDDHNPTGSRAAEVEGRIRMLEARLEKMMDSGNSGTSDTDSKTTGDTKTEKSTELPPPPNTIALDSLENKTPATTTPSSSTSAATTTPTAASSTASKASTPKAATAAQQSRAGGSPGFSLVASYSMKRIKRSGKMVYNMNQYRTETQAFAMAENIGDIYKRYGNDDQIFRAVTIDDPVFKQREILVTLDGQDAETFAKYLNFVTVKMRKRHQGGETTTDEIVITPETFQSASNSFTMVYGWNDDSNRSAWLNYEYQAVWSFHGGVEIRNDWQQTDTPMLALVPPHRYRTVSIEADGGTLTDAGVRHAVVTFTCRIGDDYVSRQATIRNNSTAPAMMVDVPEDMQSPETKVDITWYLTKGRQVSADPFTLESDIVYWDELPEGGA